MRLLLLLLLAFAAVCYVSVDLRERLLVQGLFSGIEQVQALSAKQLQNYPSKTAALSLIALLNSEAPSTESLSVVSRQIASLEEDISADKVAEPRRNEAMQRLLKLQERYQEQLKQYLQTYPRKSKLANASLESLCRLSGHSFGSSFQQNQPKGTWVFVGKDDWEKILEAVNSWSLRTFGRVTLPGI